MRTFFHLLFRRRLDPRSFLNGLGAASILIFIFLIVLTLTKANKRPAPLEVYPPLRMGRDIDQSELSVIDSIEYPIRGAAGETILGLGSIKAFVISPDWKRAATGNSMGVFVWDLAEDPPSVLKWFKNQNDIPESLAFSPDGQRLVQGNEKGSMTLWEIESGKILFHIRAHLFNFITRTVFSPDGTQLATGDRTGIVKLWNTETGKIIERFSDGHKAITALSYTPDGQYLLAGSEQNDSLTIRAIQTNELILSKGEESARYFSNNLNLLRPSAMFSPDGRRIIALCPSNATQPYVLWDVDLSEDRCEIKQEQKMRLSITSPMWLNLFQRIAFSPDGKQLLSGVNKAELWNVETGERIRAYQDDGYSIAYVSFSMDGRQFVTFHPHQNFFQFRAVDTGNVVRKFHLHSYATPYTYFQPDGQHVLSGTSYGETWIWDLETGRSEQAPSLKTEETQLTIGYSTGGQWLLTQPGRKENVEYKAVCYLWDVQSGEKILTLKGHQSFLYSCVFFDNNSKLAGVGGEGDITVWDIETGEMTFSVQENQAYAYFGAALSPDQTKLAVLSKQSKSVDLWDLQTGASLRSLPHPEGLFPPILFTPDEKSIITSKGLEFIQIADIESGSVRAIPCINKQRKNCMAVSPDCESLAIAGSDGRITFWDLETMNMTGYFRHNTRFPMTIDFSPDGKQLLISCSSGLIRVFTVSDHLITSTISMVETKR